MSMLKHKLNNFHIYFKAPQNFILEKMQYYIHITQNIYLLLPLTFKNDLYTMPFQKHKKHTQLCLDADHEVELDVEINDQ